MTQYQQSLIGKDAAAVGLNKQSILGMVYEDRPFVLTTGTPISGEYTHEIVTSGGMFNVPAIMVTLENGNSGTRGMGLHFFTHKAAITETDSVFEEESQNLIYSTDESGESWQEENTTTGVRSLTFRVGAFADGQDLPIGPTDIRWADPRFVKFNEAVIVTTLRAMGYGPGMHYVCICPGARNEEVNVGTGVKPSVQEALKKGLQSFVLWRNKDERYDIRIVEVMKAVPQTFGSHYAFDTDMLGNSLHPDVPVWNWFDLGFFDSHEVTVRRVVGKHIRVTGVKVTDGMSKMVRELGTYLRQQGHFPQMAPPSYAQSLEMMRTGQVKIGGLPLDDEQEAARGRGLIEAYLNKEGGILIGKMMSNHPTIDSRFGFTGGGVTDLVAQIREQTKQRPRNLTTVLPSDVTRVGNVAGLYWLQNLAKRKRSVLRTAY